MKFLMTYASDPSIPPTPDHMEQIAKFSEEMAKSGVLIMTGGLVRPTQGTKVRYSAGKFSVTDGPFAETKELIDGFALVRAGSKQEAIDLARRFMAVAGDGEGEILQVFDAADLGPG
jgi:hypothetical protein